GIRVRDDDLARRQNVFRVGHRSVVTHVLSSDSPAPTHGGSSLVGSTHCTLKMMINLGVLLNYPAIYAVAHHSTICGDAIFVSSVACGTHQPMISTSDEDGARQCRCRALTDARALDAPGEKQPQARIVPARFEYRSRLVRQARR